MSFYKPKPGVVCASAGPRDIVVRRDGQRLFRLGHQNTFCTVNVYQGNRKVHIRRYMSPGERGNADFLPTRYGIALTVKEFNDLLECVGVLRERLLELSPVVVEAPQASRAPRRSDIDMFGECHEVSSDTPTKKKTALYDNSKFSDGCRGGGVDRLQSDHNPLRDEREAEYDMIDDRSFSSKPRGSRKRPHPHPEEQEEEVEEEEEVVLDEEVGAGGVRFLETTV